MADDGGKKIKRTHTFDRSLLARLEQLARKERRKVSEQLAILLEDALERAEREKSPGPRVPARLESVLA